MSSLKKTSATHFLLGLMFHLPDHGFIHIQDVTSQLRGNSSWILFHFTKILSIVE